MSTNIFLEKYSKFAVIALVYILVVIRTGNFWLLTGLGVIYNIYVSKKINRTFRIKREGKKSAIIEWLDDLILPVVFINFW